METEEHEPELPAATVPAETVEPETELLSDMPAQTGEPELVSDMPAETGGKTMPDNSAYADTLPDSVLYPTPQEVKELQVPISEPPPEISQKALDARLRRVTKPRSNGTYLIPEDIRKAYEDLHGGGRDQVRFLFERAAYDPAASLLNHLDHISACWKLL